MRSRIYLLLLLSLVFIIYGQTLSFGFVSDDLFYLNENYLIRHPLNVSKLIDVPEDGLMGEMSSGLLQGRNLRDVSYAVDYWIWGENPSGFHFTNILLHLLAGLLLYRFGRIYLSREAALAGVTLFLLHPVNTEVVAYISGRKESLMSIAVLASLLTLEKSRKPGGAWLLPFSLAAYCVAFFVKEAAIVLTGLVVLKDVLLDRIPNERREGPPFSRRRIAEWMLFGAAGIALFFVRFDGANIGDSSFQYPGMHPLFLIPFYALRFIFPSHLQFEYRGGFPDFWAWLINSQALQWTLLALIVVSLFVLIRRNHMLGYFALWFYIALAPVLHFVPFHTPAAEHYLYLPGMGACLLLGALVTRIRWPNSRMKYAAIVFAVVGLTVFSINRVQDYETDYILFKDAYSKSSQNMHAYYGMALGGIRSGDISVKEGILTFERFSRGQPEVGTYSFVLGHLYEKAGQKARARDYYKEAIKYGKRPWEVYVALGRLEIERGNLKQAEETLLRLNDNYAYHPESYILLGTLRMLAGDAASALQYYERASDIDLHSDKADIGTDFALWKLGRMTSSQFRDLHPEVAPNATANDDALADAALGHLLRKPENPGALEVLI